MQKQKVYVLVGATASGKTSTGVELAKRLNGEIISADSMQIYKHMNIGTAKPTSEEQQGIPHHMIDCVMPDENYSVAQYVEAAEIHIESIMQHHKVPIVVGGTGLYINGLTMPWGFGEESRDESVRIRLEQLAETQGSQYLYDRLKTVDPDSAAIIHANNTKRVIRALEIYEVSGKTKSQRDREAQLIPTKYNYLIAGLNWDRALLYQRIDRRVDQMMQQGLTDEVRMLIDSGYDLKCQSMKALGYKEFFPYFEGKIDLEETIRVLKRDTRHFAKRQLTWFRKDQRIRWFDCSETTSSDELVGKIADYFTRG